MSEKTPQVGMRVTVYGIECRIVRIHPAGTIDVSSIRGDHHYRLSGLPITMDSK